MKFTMQINMEGEALTGNSSGQELARILRDAATHVQYFWEGDIEPLHDVNGNRVGEWAVV